MPSFQIHLAVAIKYCNKNNIKDREAFFRGSIAPDLVEDKSITHYTGFRDKNDLKKFLFEKVRLYEFLKNEKIDSNYQEAVFLHLITDFLFFNDFFDKKYIEDNNHDDFTRDLYYSYKILNDHLEEKYKLSSLGLNSIMNQNIAKTLKNKNIDDSFGQYILPADKIEDFIERVSNIDINKYKNKILQEKTNVII